MAVIRINAVHDRPQLHRGNLCVHTALARHMGPGPVIVMIHGYKYQPDIPDHCPHLNIMSMKPRDTSVRSLSWLRHTGFGAGNENEGLAIAFG